MITVSAPGKINLMGEYELDHIFIGQRDGPIILNKEEAAAYQWKSWDDLVVDMQKNSSKYTPWVVLMAQDSRLQNGLQAI
jgi:isopentenyl-diphosphate delta-isomerase